MIGTGALRAWSWAHRWSSLVCTAFMLLLCLTGLPLIFHHQLDRLLGNSVVAPVLPEGTGRIDVDRVLEVARARWPGKAVQFVSQEEDDDRVWFVTLSDSVAGPAGLKQVAVDARTGAALGEPPLDRGVMWVILSLHVDLFAGLPGKLFLGAMGVLLLVAIGSGVVLYAPFSAKLAFGEVRRERAPRTRWLDLHNLLGIATLAWALVVAATGVVNTLVDLAYDHWRSDQLADMVAPYRLLPPPERLGRLQPAIDAALRQQPAMRVKFVAFPGTAFASPHHYGIYLRGQTPLTARLHTPVLVDARTGQVTASRQSPWYLVLMQLAQPLHFGDYGGWPLQLVWAGLDLVTIVVLGSGLWLWWTRRRRMPAAVAPAATARRSAAARRIGPWRRSTWTLPVALSVVSGAGLVAGLLGDGAWDLVASLGLGVPLAVCFWYGVMAGR